MSLKHHSLVEKCRNVYEGKVVAEGRDDPQLEMEVSIARADVLGFMRKFVDDAEESGNEVWDHAAFKELMADMKNLTVLTNTLPPSSEYRKR